MRNKNFASVLKNLIKDASGWLVDRPPKSFEYFRIANFIFILFYFFNFY